MTGQLWGEEEGKEGGRRHEEKGGEGGMGSVTLVKIKEGDRRRAFLGGGWEVVARWSQSKRDAVTGDDASKQTASVASLAADVRPAY